MAAVVLEGEAAVVLERDAAPVAEAAADTASSAVVALVDVPMAVLCCGPSHSHSAWDVPLGPWVQQPRPLAAQAKRRPRRAGHSLRLVRRVQLAPPPHRSVAG